MTSKVTHGIFYTDKKLAQFATWFSRDVLPKDPYTLLDPCCGSGNLFLDNPFLGNHTVIASDIFPSTVAGSHEINFLSCSAKEYLEKVGLNNLQGDLVIFANPPYRGDKDQTAGSIDYKIHPSILDVIGDEGGLERYNCFLAQMKLICDQATSHNLPGNSLLLLFTKTPWLTNRPSFQKLRHMMTSSFDFDRGFMINGKEFFEGLKGKFPIAFTIWRYREKQINKNPIPVVTLSDLTWLSKKDFDFFKDERSGDYDTKGEDILNNHKTVTVAFGVKRENLRKWCNMYLKNFVRNRRKNERDDPLAGGLPLNDRRRTNKVTYGETTGSFIGFMDDLTPCRIKKADVNVPWFYLDSRFMRVSTARCFSGPPDNRGYHASDLSSAEKCFVWYALARTFQTCGYPMWVNAEELWMPADISSPLYSKLIDYAFAIGYAENECVETVFPANNPVKGAPEITIANPMTPNNPKSFWNMVMRPAMSTKSSLVDAVNCVYDDWANRFDGHTTEIKATFTKPYFIETGVLRKTAGLIQIRHYAEAVNDDILPALDKNMKRILKATKQAFYDFLIGRNGLDYFGTAIDK